MKAAGFIWSEKQIRKGVAFAVKEYKAVAYRRLTATGTGTPAKEVSRRVISDELWKALDDGVVDWLSDMAINTGLFKPGKLAKILHDNADPVAQLKEFMKYVKTKKFPSSSGLEWHLKYLQKYIDYYENNPQGQKERAEAIRRHNDIPNERKSKKSKFKS